MSSNENWVLGISLGLLGSILINTGNNIQSYGLRQLKDGHRRARRKQKTHPNEESNGANSTMTTPSPCESSIWIIGTVVFVSGSLLNFTSYAFAAQSMLASLESVQFVTNLIFGKVILKAKITKRMMIGTLFTVIGTIVAVQFSSKITLELNINDLIKLYTNGAYIGYLVAMVIALIALNRIYNYYRKRKERQMPLKHGDIIMPLSYSIWSALVGTQSVVQAKILAELLAVQASGKENAFKSVFLYITFVLWFITALIWLRRLNKSLSEFNPLFIIPLLQCSFIFFAIVSGGIFFQEFNSFTGKQWLGFWLGVLIMFNGLRLLTPPPPKDRDKSEFSHSSSIVVLGDDDSKCEMNQGRTSENCPEILSPPDVKNTASNDTGEVGTKEENVPYNTPVRQTLRGAALQVVKDNLLDLRADMSELLLTPPNSSSLLAKYQEEVDPEEKRRKDLLDLKEFLGTGDSLFSIEVIDLINRLDLNLPNVKNLTVEEAKQFISEEELRLELARQVNLLLEEA